MVTMNKPVKKTIKKPLTKKAVPKKLASKKTIVLKKATVRKKTEIKKSFGFFTIAVGVVCLLVLLAIGVNGVFSDKNDPTVDQPVLGWISKPSNTVAAPTGLRATAVHSSVMLKWNKVPNASVYNIYRASGLFGGMIRIKSIAANSNTYMDDSTQPGRIYRYQVTATKVSYESKKSAAAYIKTSRTSGIKAPVATVTNQFSSGYSIEINVNLTKSGSSDGYYVYCDNCIEKKMFVSSSQSSNYAEVIGRGSDGTGSFMTIQVKGLSEGNRYNFQLSQIKKSGSKIIESPKTRILQITTPKVSSTPAEPTRFKQISPSSRNRVVFQWDSPAKVADSYYLSVDCKIGTTYTGGWRGEVVPYPFETATGGHENPYLGFDIDNFGVGKGKCNARLVAKFITQGEDYSSTPATTVFNNGSDVVPSAPTGFEYHGAIVGGGLAFKWDIPKDEVMPEGYSLSISCPSANNGMWTNDSVVPFGFQTSSNNNPDPTTYYGYDISSFGSGFGNCTAKLAPYIMDVSIKVFGPEVSTEFMN